VTISPIISDLTAAKLNGFLTQEVISASSDAAGTAIHLTKYATAQYFAGADFWGLSLTSAVRVVDGATTSPNAFTIPSNGSFGTFDSPYILAANTGTRWYTQTSTPVLINGILWRLSLPVR